MHAATTPPTLFLSLFDLVTTCLTWTRRMLYSQGRQPIFSYHRAAKQHGCSGTRSVRNWTIAVEFCDRYSVGRCAAGRLHVFSWLTGGSLLLSPDGVFTPQSSTP